MMWYRCEGSGDQWVFSTHCGSYQWWSSVAQHSRSICHDCKKERTIMGHLQRRLSTVCSFFLWRGVTISCTVTGGGRRYSVDLYITLNLILCTVHKSASLIFVALLPYENILTTKYSQIAVIEFCLCYRFFWFISQLFSMSVPFDK